MKPNISLIFLSAAAASLVFASGPHTGGVYTVQPAVLDGGGGRSSSASYTNDGSLLDLDGPATGGVYAVGQGYIAQFVSTAPVLCPEFTAWQTTHFGSPAAPNAGPALDPDNDGVTNLAEFAFNMNPQVANDGPLPPGGSSGLPRFATESVLGQARLTVEFIARPGCLSYEFQASTDMANWTNVSHTEVSPPVSLGNGLERRKWADSAQFGSGQRRFLRVLTTL